MSLPPRPRCEVCGVFVHFGWRRCPRCIDLPSPAEIAARAAEVRRTWTARERARRAVTPREPVSIPVLPDPEYREW